MSSEELRLFDKVRVFLDEDYSSAEHFTALGNFYFVHESLKDVLLWDFKECSFVPANGKEVHSGNIEAVTTKEKAKFPQEFFPECKWSRKGFLRTRWNISGTVVDLINIHLFHDASNFVAMETFPSVYSKTRRRALEHTLDRFHSDQYPNAPYFLFGDFNFRTDTASVIKKLTEDTEESKLPSKGNISRLQFRNKEDDLILTLGKKEFSHFEHQHVFIENSGQWLREYDRELEDFDGRLFEFPIKFVPSYPFEEDIKGGTNYMKTRVPAWCDRVLLSPTAKTLVQDISTSNAVEYGIIGPATCMGDHKPVFLRAVLASDAGMRNCCRLPNAPEFCFRVPDNYLELLSMLPDYRSCAGVRALSVDRSSNLLHAVPIKHDPYTPDSMDSPSPNAIIVSGEVPDVDLDNLDSHGDARSILRIAAASSNTKRIDRAVSPALLKSKLELIARSKNRNSVDYEFESMDIKRSPSECHLHTWPDKEEQQRGLRKNRSNSDVSWQRSHLLTQAWIQGGGKQGYHSFTHFGQRSSRSSPVEGNEGTEGLPSDLIIPRIAIINASNFESNESSVHLHDDRHSTYSDNRLSTYSDHRTKTISGDGSSLEKSDEICNKIDEESEKLSTNTDDKAESIEADLTKDSHEEELISKSIMEEVRVQEKRIQSIDTRFTQSFRTKQSLPEDVGNENASKDTAVETREYRVENSGTKHIILDLPDGVPEDNETVQKLLNSEDSNEKDHRVGAKEGEILAKNSTDEDHAEANDIPKSYQTNACKSALIKESPKSCTRKATANEIEVLRSDSRQEMLASKATTRSNSIQSQDASENPGNAKLKLKAYEVTESYKKGIAKNKGRCQKCCCIVS
ncbi:uncharacterized protein LOC107263069 isoform X2 [Cephus cinctus]|nr:uncharacterized protein LOC107263069 isoform X2 [Cephus cinctus]